jgi:hypothetical protein
VIRYELRARIADVRMITIDISSAALAGDVAASVMRSGNLPLEI